MGKVRGFSLILNKYYSITHIGFISFSINHFINLPYLNTALTPSKPQNITQQERWNSTVKENQSFIYLFITIISKSLILDNYFRQKTLTNVESFSEVADGKSVCSGESECQPIKKTLLLNLPRM